MAMKDPQARTKQIIKDDIETIRAYAALQKLRRQDVQQLGGAGGVGVHVAGDIQPLLPRLL